MRMRQIVICGLSGCKYFSNYLINGTNFGKKKVIEHKVCFNFLYNFSLQLLSETFLTPEELKRYDQKCILVRM